MPTYAHILWLCSEDPPCLPWPLCQEGQPVNFGAFKCVFGRKGPLRTLEESQGLSSLNVLSAVTADTFPALLFLSLSEQNQP